MCSSMPIIAEGVSVGVSVTVMFSVTLMLMAVAGHVRNKTDTLFEVLLTMERSCKPSPLKSPTATKRPGPDSQPVSPGVGYVDFDYRTAGEARLGCAINDHRIFDCRQHRRRRDCVHSCSRNIESNEVSSWRHIRQIYRAAQSAPGCVTERIIIG